MDRRRQTNHFWRSRYLDEEAPVGHAERFANETAPSGHSLDEAHF
jgi:hypothetical protein